LIAYLARLEIDLPLFILCTARPSLDESHPNWGNNFPLSEVVTIKNLDLDASRELVGEILQNVPNLPQELVETLARNAEGNPFYLEELIKVLIEDGVIVKGEDIWQIVPQRLLQLRVPATLTGVLQARLDRLPSMESDVLERAAVIGRTFWDAAVEAMRGSESAQAIAGEDVRSVLSALRNKELVFPHLPSTFDTVQEFIFKHAILREVTYERVLKAKRKLYHRMAADWLIQQSGERIEEYLGLIAQHYELAGDTVRAVDFLERAAEGGRVRAGQDRERPDTSGMTMRGEPGHLATPVVADQMERPARLVGSIRDVEHVLDQPVDPVGGQALGRIRSHPRGVATLIRRDRAIAGTA